MAEVRGFSKVGRESWAFRQISPQRSKGGEYSTKNTPGGQIGQFISIRPKGYDVT